MLLREKPGDAQMGARHAEDLRTVQQSTEAVSGRFAGEIGADHIGHGVLAFMDDAASLSWRAAQKKMRVISPNSGSRKTAAQAQ